MADINSVNKLHTEEGQKKAESLFSKQFIQYLASKKISATALEKPPPQSDTPSGSYYSKELSESSDETTTSESSRKSSKRTRRKTKDKRSHWDVQYGFRNKLTQCSLLKDTEEVTTPDELRPLLANMTILLQDFKQSRSEYDNLFNLISKITVLVTEFTRRPLKKLEENDNGNYARNVQKTINGLINLLDDYKTGPMLEPDNGVREYKRIIKNITAKNLEIADLKRRISEAELQIDTKTKDVTEKVRNSILSNEKLKNEIKFNQGQIKKYKKILIEKEWAKHKTGTELSHLRVKSSKMNFPNESCELQESKSEKKREKKGTMGSRIMKGKRTREKNKLECLDVNPE